MVLAQISGQPATGKTTGLRTLDPNSTYIIDADSKGLPWRGWKSQYNAEKKNYAAVTNPTAVYKIVKGVAETRPEINCIVIDTINAIMTTEEMEILKNPTRDKWADLASDIWEIYKLIREIKRDDLVVFVMAHIEPYDVNGVTHWRTMTNGKKLTKINLNAFLTYNLYSKVIRNGTEPPEYKLVTQSDGTTEARSLMGVFDPMIDNDLEVVRKKILEAEKG